MSTEIAPVPVPVQRPLTTRIAAFRGFPHKMLVSLLSDPDKSINAHLADIGIAIGTYYSWRGSLPDYAATVDAIRDYAGNIRNEAVRAIWDAFTQPIAIRMAERSLGDSVAAQRAAERILETVGVLRKEGDLPEGTESFDLIALRIRRKLGST